MAKCGFASRKMNTKLVSTIGLIFRLIVATIFMIAGVLKIMNLDAFAITIQGYEVISPGIAALAARSVPIAEIIFSLSLLTGIFSRSALLGISLLSIIFLIVTAQGLMRGLHVECGCFGKLDFDLGPRLLIAKSILFVVLPVALYALCAGQQSRSSDSPEAE